MGPPIPIDGRENTLLLRCKFCADGPACAGARLGRPAPWNILLDTERLTDDRPASAPKAAPPDEERWKFGCCGRPEEFINDMERVFWDVNGPLKPMELVRFRADEG